MSIIRDLLEYYRLPSEIKQNIVDFEVSHTLLNGREDRYYYSNYGGYDLAMVVDMYTSADVRYRRSYYYYDLNLDIKRIDSEFDFGTRKRSEVFGYDVSNPRTIVRSTVTLSYISVTWSDLPVSTGWPYYNLGVEIVSAGDNILINNTDPSRPVISVSNSFLLGIAAGSNVTIDNTNPQIPVVNSTQRPTPLSFSTINNTIQPVNAIAPMGGTINSPVWHDYISIPNIPSHSQNTRLLQCFARIVLDQNSAPLSGDDVFFRVMLNDTIVIDRNAVNLLSTGTASGVCNLQGFYLLPSGVASNTVKIQIANPTGQNYLLNGGNDPFDPTRYTDNPYQSRLDVTLI